MSKIPKTNAWANGVACLAIALLAAGAAFAQQQSDQDQSNQDQQQSSDEQEQQDASQSETQSDQQARERQQQLRERQQQARERQQQAGQRSQQARERSQQEGERSQQDRQRGESQWDEQSSRQRGQQNWPQSSRSEFSGDESREFRGESQLREHEYGSDTQRSAQRGDDQEAGLGISIIADDTAGIVVARVHPGSPAEDMGLRQRDRITHINGRPVRGVRDFISRIRNMEPGEDVELDIRRSGDERTVRGELESRDEALVLRGQQWGTEFGPPQRDRYSSQDRENWQTSYEEERRFGSSQGRSGQVTSSRIEQLQRQVDRMSQELDELRFALRDIRRQSDQSREPGQWDRETTARYDQYQSRTIESPRRSSDRWDNSNRFRQADRSRGVGRSGDYQSGQQDQRSRQSDSGQSGERSSQNESDRQRTTGQSETGQDRDDQSQFRDQSPGGEIGEERLRVQSNERDRD